VYKKGPVSRSSLSVSESVRGIPCLASDSSSILKQAKLIVEEWDEWPRGLRLQGEEAGKAGPREGQQDDRTTKQQNINKITEYQQDNRILTRQQNINKTTEYQQDNRISYTHIKTKHRNIGKLS
jgi:hypothetical protein